MNATLEQTVERLRQLPSDEQDRLVALLEEELAQIERDRAFDELLASRPDVLLQMAAEVQAEIDAGLTAPLDLDEL